MKTKPYVAATDYGKRESQKNKHVIAFGDLNVTLYRRSDVQNSSWFFRIHIKQEDRNYRKSLDTDDLPTAKKRAHTEVIKILAKVESGQRVLALALKDLVRQFSLHMENLVRQDQISPRTWISQRYRIRTGLEFLKTKYPNGIETRVTDIDGKLFHGYLDWRLAQLKAKGRTIQRDVVRDELLVIRKMFLFARKEKLCTEKSIPNWDFVVEKQGPKRERISGKNYSDFFNAVTQWVKEARDAKTFYHRMMLMHAADLVGISGMRSGEVFGLRNKDVEVRGDDCVLKIRAETSKVRRSRQVTILTTTFKDWLNHQKHKEPSDFVFSPFDSGKTSARDVFYHQYKSLRVALKNIALDWFDLYHCRHWWITNRLIAEEPIHLVAQAAGTSVKEIESTYSHVMTELTTKRFNKKEVVWKPDGNYEVIQRQIRETYSIFDELYKDDEAESRAQPEN
jgi:integrase